jgi:hypothetical protein
MTVHIEIGRPEGKTQYSDYAEQFYEKQRKNRDALSASEFWVVHEGYLREWVCMGQCNLYIQAAQEQDVKQAIEIYRHDVCEPNLTELQTILEQDGYMLPKDYNAKSAAKSVQELGDLPSTVISDEQIVLGMMFSAHGFMNRWNMSAAASKRTDVRDAFVRNWHRANRWHEAFYALAVEKGFMMPLPTMDIKGLMRTTTMGG